MATLVVAASGGIGQATAARLRADGQDVIEMNRRDGVDALDPDAVRRFLAGKGPIDKLVHLAGTVGKGGIEDHTVAQWREVMDNSVTTAFVVCQAVIPGMRQRKSGSIVLMSSVNGRTGGNRLSGPAYAAAKAAIFGLIKHLAMDLAGDGIRVNGIAPGPVATPMLERLSQAELDALVARIPLKKVTTAEQVAAQIAFLLSDDSATITGTVLDVNGGTWMN